MKAVSNALANIPKSIVAKHPWIGSQNNLKRMGPIYTRRLNYGDLFRSLDDVPNR